MRRGGRVLILLGLLLAIVSGAGVFMVLATAQPGPAQVDRTKVIIAMQPISERSEITADQVGVASWPILSDFPIPPGAFTDPKEVVGKLASGPIAQGQPIVEANVIDKSIAKEKRSNASFVVDKGNVAIALPLTALSSVASAVQNGDRVDLIATFTVEPVNQSAAPVPNLTATQRTLQNLLVLQVGAWPNAAVQTQQNSSQAAAANVITLQVTEQDAQVLKYIETQSAEWAFALRPVNDEQLYNPQPVTIEYVNKRFGYNFPSAR